MNGPIDLLAEPLAGALVHFLWQGSLVALLLGTGLWLARGRSAAFRYNLSCWALLVLVAVPVVTAGWRLRQDAPAGAVEFPAVEGHVTPAQSPERETAEPASLTKPPPATFDRPRLSVPALVARYAAPAVGRLGLLVPRERSFWIIAVWLGGVLGLSLFNLGGWLRVRRLRRGADGRVSATVRESVARLRRELGMNRAVQVLRSAAVKSPVVIGWLRPVILLPVSACTGLPAHQLECILAHELAHIWRRDYLVNLLQVAAETLLFYHPAVWWVSQQIRLERENCCDDIAVGIAGDRVAYARALVDLEELRLASPRLALGADGGSLLRRVQRLVGGQSMSQNANRSSLPGIVAAMLIMVCGFGLALSAQSQAQARTDRDADADARIRGEWTAERRADQLQFSLRDDVEERLWNLSLDVDLDDLQGLDFAEDAEFTLRREAGVWRFRGDFDGSGRRAQGTGTFTFTADEDYVDRLDDLTRGSLDSQELLVLAAQDLRIETVEELLDLGYGPLRTDELMSVAIFRVTPEFIREMEENGYEDLELETLIACRVHRVNGDYIEEMEDAGFAADSLQDWISWRIFNITPEFQAEMRNVFGDVSNDQIMSMKIHGVTRSFARRMAKLGYDLDADELLTWRIHRVDEDFIEAMEELGFRNLEAQELVNLRIFQVTPKWIRHLRSRGLDDLDVDDLVRLKISGVDL